MPFKPHFSWDFLLPEEIEERSLRAFKNHIDYLKRDSDFYREKLEHISSEDIVTLADISKIPITEKEEFSRESSRFQVAPEDLIIETVVTSGSTGDPLLFPLTASDLDRLAYNESLSFHGAGVSAKDRALILVSLDRLFIAGMAYYRGLTALGANTSRIGVLPMEMQHHYLNIMKPTVLVGVPSYLIKLGEYLRSNGMNADSIPVNKIFCIGEPIRDEDMAFNDTANQIEDLYGASVYSTYASTEVASTFCDCTEQAGGHAHHELLYVEILDEAGEPVPDGTVGELVVTPFGVEGMPLLRYRTGDLTFKIPGECKCGRHSTRIGPILSRRSELLKFKGTTLYPLTITNVLDTFPGLKDYIIELKGREGSASEEIFIHAAIRPDAVQQVMMKVQAATRVTIPILVSNEATINSMRGDSRKKLKLVDNRKKL